ncbi:MAG: hypothetical protein F4066_08775 [Chloroflexi bacterium]|nr:hypothetical protein [Chloroflexota bacterium]MYF80173.1 hypothetical protein [Chloroflexota bacterium]MYI04933.1 hypothetical protein [Chloroflexota bacterium]
MSVVQMALAPSCVECVQRQGWLLCQRKARHMVPLVGCEFARLGRAALLAMVLLLSAVAGAALTLAGAEEPSDLVTQEMQNPAVPGLTAAAFSESLSGRVYVWDHGRLRPAASAKVSTGSAMVRTDSSGRFQFGAEDRTGSLTVIQPGYDIVRRPIYFDQTVIVLRSLVVRAVYIPFNEMTDPVVQAWAHDLVDRNLINAVVVDIKDEVGLVYSFAATPTVRQMEADRDGESVAAFLEELKNKGVYRIGRVVTFLDRTYPRWFTDDALRSLSGGLFFDSMGSTWSSAYKSGARRYNIEIGVAAADYVEEIQYDYVRLPYENGLLERQQYSAADRVAAITRFAKEASAALHLAGLAVSFDTFGVVSTAGNDQGIGQSVEGLAPYLDYISPMVYPSGWTPGSFGYAYPPAHPGPVVQRNVEATVERIETPGSALVRPWLQDFHDYQRRGLPYLAEQVHAQIAATAAAGGFGFMLWDPSLRYEQQALEQALAIVWADAG